MKKILVFGSCNIDYVYKMVHFVKPGETASSLGRECFPGGKGLNQSIAIARSGMSVYHAGCIGRDGMFLKAVLEEAGANTDFLKITDTPTGHAVIQVDGGGENCIILYAGANHLIDEEYTDFVIDKFDSGDMIVLQNEISGIEYVIEKAYLKNLQIIFNPSPFYGNIKRLDLNKISYLILNEVEAAEFCGSSEPEVIIAYFRERYRELKVVLTLGARGSVYFDGEYEERCPSFSVPVVDTTSAGDTFTGYFISSMKSSGSVKKALVRASAAAALAVSRKGAASSIPYSAEIDAALSYLSPNRNYSIQTEKQKELIADYIKKNLKDASLCGAASALGYSSPYAATWIKKNMGKSFTSLLLDERCKNAARLLRESDMPIKDIITECGYENSSFFRKIFFARLGKSPLEYRKFYRNK